jgi:hypothetical protein
MLSVSLIPKVITFSYSYCNFYLILHRITDDVDGKLNLENFLFEVTNPILENIKINYSNQYQDSDVVTTAVDKAFYYGSENIIVGKLLEEPFSITLEGASASGRVSRQITIPAMRHTSNTSMPGNEPYFERLWASLKIKNLIKQFQPFSYPSAFEEVNLENQNQILHGKVIELATKYNLVTYLTPFIVTDKTIVREDEILSAEPDLTNF